MAFNRTRKTARYRPYASEPTPSVYSFHHTMGKVQVTSCTLLALRDGDNDNSWQLQIPYILREFSHGSE